MDNREIDKLIHTRVMCLGGIASRYTVDISWAWQVVQKLETLGYWAQLRTPFDLAENNDGYWCGFTPHLTTGWNGRPDHWTNAPTITMAICLAALEVIGVEIPFP